MCVLFIILLLTPLMTLGKLFKLFVYNTVAIMLNFLRSTKNMESKVLNCLLSPAEKYMCRLMLYPLGPR